MVSRIAIVILALSALAACGGGHGDRASGGDGGGGTLTIKGSDTMVILAQRWAEEFMREHPGATIQVSGGGTGTGIAALIHGTTDIADASRPIGAREIREIRSLTLAQLSAIYRGAIRDWSEVGGPRRPIVLYSRENNSGTYAYFKAHVLGDLDFAPETQTLPGTAAVINAVSQDPAGIGYGGIGYAARVKTLAIAAEGRAPVRPTIDAATSGRYPLARDLCVYTVGEPRGLARRFVEWVRSPAGQRLVEAAGYYPLPRGGAAAELR